MAKMKVPAEARKKIEAEAARRGLADPRKRFSRYCLFEPFPKQWEFINCPAEFILYGGGAGGAKSTGALCRISMRAEQEPREIWVIRRHLKDMRSTNGIYRNAEKWWKGTGVVHEKQDHMFIFPNGSLVQFLAVDHESDWEKIQGNSATDIFLEEMTQFEQKMINLLKTRLRKRPDQELPTCLCGTANPGGRSHDYCREFFVDPKTRAAGHAYIHATYLDNPGIDQADYKRKFDAIPDPVIRAQQEKGDWSAKGSGRFCTREMFKIIEREDVPPMYWTVRGWDIGLTNEGDPWAGVLKTRQARNFYTLNVKEKQMKEPVGREFILDTMRTDPVPTLHAMENQAISLPTIDNLALNERIDLTPWENEKEWDALRIYTEAESIQLQRKIRLTAVPCKGDKLAKASLDFEALHEGNFYIVKADWNEEFIDEYCFFMNEKGDKDNKIDAGGNASRALVRLPDRLRTIERPLEYGSEEYLQKFLEVNGLA